MGRLCTAAVAGMAALVLGAAQAGTLERRAGDNAFPAASAEFLPVNAPVHRRCDFIRDPECSGAWSPAPRSKTRRSATAAAPVVDAEAPTPAEGASLAAAAGCPPGDLVGAKGECVAPKPLATGCAPGDVLGAKGQCVKPLPVTIPEPGTLPLAAIGLASVFALSRRRAPARPR